MPAHRYLRPFTLLVWLASAIPIGAKPFLAQAMDALPQSASAAALSTLSPEAQGDLFMARGSYAAALGAYQRGPLESAVIWNKMGIAYHHLFALEEARKHYQKALALNPHYAEALNNLAAVYHGEHNDKQAEKTYKKALKYAPDSAVTYSNLGTSYLSDQKYKLGAQAYQKALALNPNIFDPSQRKQLVEDGGSRTQAAAVNYYLAKTYATVGNKEQALAFLRKALDAGFNDRRRLMEDPDFAQLRDMPEFQQLLQQMHELRTAHHATG
jgi:tetratricopeptide (TPR) repeat protein